MMSIASRSAPCEEDEEDEEDEKDEEDEGGEEAVAPWPKRRLRTFGDLVLFCPLRALSNADDELSLAPAIPNGPRIVLLLPLPPR